MRKSPDGIARLHIVRRTSMTISPRESEAFLAFITVVDQSLVWPHLNSIFIVGGGHRIHRPLLVLTKKRQITVLLNDNFPESRYIELENDLRSGTTDAPACGAQRPPLSQRLTRTFPTVLQASFRRKLSSRTSSLNCERNRRLKPRIEYLYMNYLPLGEKKFVCAMVTRRCKN